MTNMPRAPNPATLRRAVEADVDAITTIWHRGWGDGHRGHVPAALERHRHDVDDFRVRALHRLHETTVATRAMGVVGFVMAHEDEIEQLYVDASARGTGVADALLAHGEKQIETGFDRAWLAVVSGNVRARRFYERNGWCDAGPYDYAARTASGEIVAVPVRRYEKSLTSFARSLGRSETVHAAASQPDTAAAPLEPSSEAP